jgi:hypothetical protein
MHLGLNLKLGHPVPMGKVSYSRCPLPLKVVHHPGIQLVHGQLAYQDRLIMVVWVFIASTKLIANLCRFGIMQNNKNAIF